MAVWLIEGHQLFRRLRDSGRAEWKRDCQKVTEETGSRCVRKGLFWQMERFTPHFQGIPGQVLEKASLPVLLLTTPRPNATIKIGTWFQTRLRVEGAGAGRRRGSQTHGCLSYNFCWTLWETPNKDVPLLCWQFTQPLASSQVPHRKWDAA